MQISVKHVTRYTFAETVAYSIQSLRLTPPSFDGQNVLSWSVTGKPAHEMIVTSDGFGNVLHLMAVNTPHDGLEITAEGTVIVENRNGLVTGLNEAVPLRVYQKETPLTAPSPAIKALVDGMGTSDTVAKLHNLMAAIRDEVEYLPGVTTAVTTATEALAAKQGVCQDHAHIFIAASRLAGMPSRYVTGYLLTDGASTETAHHAWAETWVEGLGWVGFDVANRLCPTDAYVRMAAGLDAHYAAPLRGSRRGGAAETLSVEVAVAEEAAQQQQSQGAGGQSQSQSHAAGQGQAMGQSQGQTQAPGEPSPSPGRSTRRQSQSQKRK